MTRLRIVGAACVLLVVFLFGMWLTWPQFPHNPGGFPLDRTFVAISMNGKPLLGIDPARPCENKLPTLEVTRLSFTRLRAFGNDGCNTFRVDITLPITRSVSWGEEFLTAAYCPWSIEARQRFVEALLKTRRWRTEKGALILENDTDIIRFILAPRQ